MGRSSIYCAQAEGFSQHCAVWAPDTKVGPTSESPLVHGEKEWCGEPANTCCLFVCRSKNANNSESEVVLHELEVAAMASMILQGWGIVKLLVYNCSFHCGPCQCFNCVFVAPAVCLGQIRSSFPLPTGRFIRVWEKSRTLAQRFSRSTRCAGISSHYWAAISVRFHFIGCSYMTTYWTQWGPKIDTVQWEGCCVCYLREYLACRLLIVNKKKEIQLHYPTIFLESQRQT